MHEGLEDIKAAWDNDSPGGRNEELARSLADSFVQGNPELFQEISTKSMEQLCLDIDIFRNAGMEEQVWLIETWMLHRWAPQNIGGQYTPQVRVPGGEL